MNKLSAAAGGFRNFMSEVWQELRKCNWPTRPELMESTVIVIVSVLIVGVYVSICDVVSQGFLNLVIR
ncbi:MAG: preprotein translocase subunit SecE [Kiritimatiellia bacterium]